jgi:hypothetical protein
VLEYLRGFAQARSLEWQQDGVGNMVIRRPGSGGGEAAATVVIQARAGRERGVPLPALAVAVTLLRLRRRRDMWTWCVKRMPTPCMPSMSTR